MYRVVQSFYDFISDVKKEYVSMSGKYIVHFYNLLK